jgi:hypothetical protein
MTQPGEIPFLSSNRFVLTTRLAGLAEHDFLWQVFWLPRPFSDLPIPTG